MTTAHVGQLRLTDLRTRERATGAVLPTATRMWAALAALGFGLVTLGIGAGHLDHHLPVGIALTVAGALGIGWAVLALRGTLPRPRPATLTLVVLAPAALLSAPLTGTALTAAEASALALGLGAAVLTALHLRCGVEQSAPPAGRLALALFVGAMLIAAVIVPGLAATTAGEHAVPHGSHGLPTEEHHH